MLSINQHKFPEVATSADQIYSELSNAGYEVLYDDRDEAAGFKFNDADLLGLPLQIIVGPKNLKEGKVEIKFRETGERQLIELSNLKEFVSQI